MSAEPADRAAATFESTRPLLFAVAYRMLGSVMDAEDILQEAYLRWQEAPDHDVRSPQAYLTTIVTRLAINQLRSARHRRETYVGPWLPEPLVTDHAPDPSGHLELAESLSMGFLVLLERLSPVERAVFLLHEVFELDYAQIAGIVGKSEVNCRQLLARAKQRLGEPVARFSADPAQADRLMERFTTAAESGDMEGLLDVLAEDITVWADGGGKVRGAALRPVRGATAAARFILGVLRRFVPADRTMERRWINGAPGLLIRVGGRPLAALAVEIRDGHIRGIYTVGNPDKLKALDAPEGAATRPTPTAPPG